MVVALAAAVFLGSAISGPAISGIAPVATTALPAPDPAPASPASAGLPDFKTIIKRNQASVVNISTRQEIRADAGRRGQPPGMAPGLPPGLPPGMEEFFRPFRGMPGPMPGPRQANSLGSGFIISADGEILTNAHVVDGADEIMVKLADNSEKPAKLIGLDKASDVALLKIDAKDLPVVRLGDSSSLEVGDWVLAIGSPFGLEHTATQGIVSAVGRSLPDGNYVPFIQTDVAVNPGNSGGPLFNIKGEVVGINSQIYSRSGGYMGLSFAIPVNTASTVARQLAANGRVERGWLGVGIQNVSGDLAKSFGLDKPTGALVGQVDKAGPASKAGLKPGDVILEFNGRPISQSGELPPLVGETRPGTKVELTVWRDKKAREINVTVAELKPAEDEIVASNADSDQKPGILNVQVAALTPEQREQAGIEAGGVLVVGVAAGPAARAGVNAGDIILQVGGQAVGSPQELAGLARKLPKGEPVPLLIQRDEARLFLPLTIAG
ncbi:MAG: DegQ family serine endoprotease [Chromatiales bacterium]|nr:DegQ family serine endoprotease [Chromatiales bacterium]